MLHWDLGGVPFTLLLAAYALGAHGSARDGIVGLGTAVVALLFGVWETRLGAHFGVDDLLPVGAVWLLGRVVARRREAATDARQRELALARDGARTYRAGRARRAAAGGA